MKLLIIPFIAAALMGCATADYKSYAEAQIAVAAVKAEADKARYQALASIAQTGGDAAKVAVVMGLQFGNQAQGQNALAAPKSTSDSMFQWASILVPAATQAYAIGKNAAVQIESSRNAAATAQSTNQAFVSIAGQIQAPGTITTTTTTTESNLSGTGVLGAGSYAIDNSSTATPTVVNQPAPIITDPVVVTQPAPVVVTQPAPVIVSPVVANPVIVDPVVVTQPAPVIVQPTP